MSADWKLGLGASVEAEGVRFTVWAPLAKSLSVTLESEGGRLIPLARGEGDLFTAFAPGLRAGADYRFLLDGSDALPDPASRWQPRGVHGPSRVVDPAAFAWTDGATTKTALPRWVISELHVGTFTPEGTFEAAVAKLPHLVALGVTAVELMPVAEFPGGRNWGYDGVSLFAPHSLYGGPQGLKRLVDACHGHGLSVVLDVVYNHLGPEGNYLSRFAPYFTDRYQTPWGAALNFDGPDSDGVRRHFLNNARYWLDEFHVDALRLDAVHGIYDLGAKHLLRELVEQAEAHTALRGRPGLIIAESDLNDVRLLEPVARGGYGVHAQWSDDFHHSLHTRLTGTRKGYFEDFGAPADLAKALREGFVYDGRFSAHRRRRHGNSSAGCGGEQLVIYTQNHDQIANGSGSDRSSKLLTLEEQKLAAALLLCAPNLPLLFMGQEWGEVAPFHYFTSHGDPALAAAVREGRAREFVSFDWAHKLADPQAPETFQACKLDWSLLKKSPHRELLACFTDLIGLRRAHESLGNCRKDLTSVSADEGGRWLVLSRGAPVAPAAVCLFNLSRDPALVPFEAEGRRWRRVLCTSAARYGGTSGEAAPLLEGSGPVSVPPSSAAIYLQETRP